jgi:hypothetical protein
VLRRGQPAGGEDRRGKLDLVRVTNLTAEMARIATAAIGDATIEAAQIHDLQAQVARDRHGGHPERHHSDRADRQPERGGGGALHAEVAVGAFDLAEVKNLLSEALALEQGTRGACISPTWR